MPRHAFKLKLKAGVLAEYARRHNPIWPELEAAIRAAGISDYSIFFDEETNTLFGVHKRVDDAGPEALKDLAVAKRWEQDMLAFLESGPDGKAVRRTLKEVFRLE